MSSKSELIRKDAILFLVFFVPAAIIFHMELNGPEIGRYIYLWLFGGLVYLYFFTAGIQFVQTKYSMSTYYHFFFGSAVLYFMLVPFFPYLIDHFFLWVLIFVVGFLPLMFVHYILIVFIAMGIDIYIRYKYRDSEEELKSRKKWVYGGIAFTAMYLFSSMIKLVAQRSLENNMPYYFIILPLVALYFLYRQIGKQLYQPGIELTKYLTCLGAVTLIWISIGFSPLLSILPYHVFQYYYVVQPIVILLAVIVSIRYMRTLGEKIDDGEV